jgi:DNA polymerase-2
VRDYAVRMPRGEMDQLLVYRKRLRRRWTTTNAMCRRMCGRRAWPMNSTAPGPPAAVPERRLDPLRDHDHRPGAAGNARSPIDYEHYLAKQLQPIADAILPFVGDSFRMLTSRQGTLF